MFLRNRENYSLLFGYVGVCVAALDFIGPNLAVNVIIIGAMVTIPVFAIAINWIKSKEISAIRGQEWFSYHVTYSQKSGKPRWVFGKFKFGSLSTEANINGQHWDVSPDRYSYLVEGARSGKHYVILEKSATLGDDCVALLMDTSDESSSKGIITGRWLGPGNDYGFVYGHYILSKTKLSIQEREDILDRQTKVRTPSYKGAEPEIDEAITS